MLTRTRTTALALAMILSVAGCASVTPPPETSVRTLLAFTHKSLGAVHDSLHPLYPNPFDRAAGDTAVTIEFDLDSLSRDIHLLIQNAVGEEVAGFNDSALAAGGYSGAWVPVNAYGERLKAGLYYVTLRSSRTIYSRLLDLQVND